MIDGVSARTLAEIRRWERERGSPGQVARDLAWWKHQAAVMCSRRWHGVAAGIYYYGYFGCTCCDYDEPPGRFGLEMVLAALPRRARREFAAVVGRIDDRVLQGTYGSEPDGVGWWCRRL